MFHQNKKNSTIKNSNNMEKLHGKTQLMLAVERGQFELVKFYINQDPVSIHAKTESNIFNTTAWDIGKTALHFACQYGRIEIANYLISSGADIHAKTQHLDSVFHYAVYSHSIPLLQLLKSVGANPLCIDMDGDSAMEWAIELNSSIEILQWFLNQGQKIKDINKKGLNFIHIAAQQGNLNILNFFKNSLHEEFMETLIIKNKMNGMNALHYAASKGHVHLIQWLHNHHMSINEKADNGSSALLCATINGKLNCVKQLKEYGASLTEKTNDGETVLMQAARSGNLELIKWLMEEAGLSFEEQKRQTGFCDEASPFHAAAFGNHTHILEWFIEKKAININSTDKIGGTALFYAATGNHIETCRWLLDRGANIHAVNKSGYTVLHYAASYGKLELVKFLKEKNINLHAKANNHSTALALAAISGKLDILKFLMDCGVEPYYKDAANRIPYSISLLQLAIKADQLNIVEYLLQMPHQYFNLNDSDSNGDFPLHIAYRHGSKKVIEYLLKKNVCVTQKNKNGQTILHLVTHKTSPDLIRYLVKDKKFPINITDNNDNTPLHVAASCGNIAVVKCLLDLGADIEARDKEQHTPLHTAISSPSYIYDYTNKIETIKHLLNAGADVNCVNCHFSDNQPATPIDYSIFQISKSRYEYVEILNLLLQSDNKENFYFYQKKLTHALNFCLNYYHTNAAHEKYNKRLIDATLGFLIGDDVNSLGVQENNDKYLAHLRRWQGTAKGIHLVNETNLEGFWQENYLALRMRFLFDLMIKIALNEFRIDHIMTKKQFQNDFEKQDYIIRHIKKEFLHELEMWHIRKLISSKASILFNSKPPLEKIPEYKRNAIYNTIAENIYEKISKLPEGEEYSIAGGWAECKWYNLYIINNLPTNLDEYSESYILIHNQLYYIKRTELKHITEKVEINHFDNFLNKLNEFNKQNKKKLALSPTQVNQLITLNSKNNHKPNTGIPHAVYINFMHIEDVLLIRIDNFGEGCYRKIQKNYVQIDLHKKQMSQLQHGHYKIYPCLLGTLPWNEMIHYKSSLINYIMRVLQASLSPYTDGIINIYNLKENDNTWINHHEIISLNSVTNNIINMFDPLLAQTVGNCVIENCRYGQKVRLRDDKEFSNWLDEEEAKHLQSSVWWQKTQEEDKIDKNTWWWDQYYSVSPWIIQNRESSISCKKLVETNLSNQQHHALIFQSKKLYEIYQNTSRIVVQGISDFIYNECSISPKPRLALEIQSNWGERLNLKWIFYIDLANLTNENYPVRHDFCPYVLSDILANETGLYEIFHEKNSWMTWRAWHKNEILLLLNNYEIGVKKLPNQSNDIKNIFNKIINYQNCIYFMSNNTTLNNCVSVNFNSHELCDNLSFEAKYMHHSFKKF